MRQHPQVGSLSISSKLVLAFVLGILVLASSANSEPALSITVSTDKTQYSPKETVSISGVVRDNQSNSVFGAGVSIQVNDPGNNIVQVQSASSDQSGAYVDTFSLALNSPQGEYTVNATASKPGYSNGYGQAHFTVLTQATSTSSSATSSTTSSSSLSTATNVPGKCLIATTTYGSELAPEVVLLRNFRDLHVLQTSAGESFMRVFNAFYYSFSPGVASYIASHSDIRAGMKTALYPLIGILYLSSLVFGATSFNGEVAVTLAGILASLGIGAVYLGPTLTILCRPFRSRSSSRYQRAIHLTFVASIASLIGMFLGEVGQLNALLTLATVGTVLSNITLGGMLVPWVAVRARSRKDASRKR
jgi:hypothetical protein